MAENARENEYYQFIKLWTIVEMTVLSANGSVDSLWKQIRTKKEIFSGDKRGPTNWSLLTA